MTDSADDSINESATMAAASTQVLEFELGHETYCVDIAHVTEIVDVGEVTEVPNTPPYVEGVMDLRGRTTAIVDPKVVFDIEGDGAERRIVVFDPDLATNGAAAGWLVDEVDRVVAVDESDVDPSPVADDPSVRGVVKRENGFVIWIDPVVVHSA